MLAWLLARLIREGTVTYTDPKGRRRDFGTGTPHVAFAVRDARWERRIAANPRLAFGEAYMEGALEITGGTLRDLLYVLTANDASASLPGPLGALDAIDRLMRRLQVTNPEVRARANVAHHYDLTTEFYDLFLDPERQYSCAYFTAPEMGLEAAQVAKMRHIAAKLCLSPGQRVLDIGCGWGGLSRHLAAEAEVEVLGVTLSAEQLAAAREQARIAGLDHRLRYELLDYRKVEGRFDRIVSVGMFEHVGPPHYGAFFDAVHRLLTPDGIALLHSICRLHGPGRTSPWLRKYIFPGGYSPALSEVIPHIEARRLFITDMEILRDHYARTLHAWQQRFAARRDEAERLFDARFCRMWEFYMIGAEMAFVTDDHAVMQIQMSPTRDAVPPTRDYIAAWEARTR